MDGMIGAVYATLVLAFLVLVAMLLGGGAASRSRRLVRLPGVVEPAPVTTVEQVPAQPWSRTVLERGGTATGDWYERATFEQAGVSEVTSHPIVAGEAGVLRPPDAKRDYRTIVQAP